MISVAMVAAERFELAHIGTRAGWSIKKLANGPGPRLALEAARMAGSDVDVMVSTGLCGALHPDLRVGDVFLATSVNGQPVELPVSRRTCVAGPLVSLDRVVGSSQEKRQLFASGAMAVEMEAAAVMEYARSVGARFYCVRAVSDIAGETFALNLNEARGADGRFRVSSILAQAARRPRTVMPELLRLRRNAGQAARALGAFFADCDF